MMLGILVVQILIGIFLTLAIEMPFIKIEKVLFPESKLITKLYSEGQSDYYHHQPIVCLTAGYRPTFSVMLLNSVVCQIRDGTVCLYNFNNS